MFLHQTKHLLDPLHPGPDLRMIRTKEGCRSKQEGDAGNDRDYEPNDPNAKKQKSHHVAQSSHKVSVE